VFVSSMAAPTTITLNYTGPNALRQNADIMNLLTFDVTTKFGGIAAGDYHSQDYAAPTNPITHQPGTPAVQLTTGGLGSVLVNAPVPEAGTLLGFGGLVGMGGLALLRRGRRK
jgi:hypothetical protein